MKAVFILLNIFSCPEFSHLLKAFVISNKPYAIIAFGPFSQKKNTFEYVY